MARAARERRPVRVRAERRTDVRWMLESTEDGTLVVFDHTGFAAIYTRFRIVTFGWAQMLTRLTQYVPSGEPVPFFVH